MEFRLLGPLEVSAAGRPLSLGGRKQRTLLALLLLNANAVVPRDRLIDALWGEQPPAEAEASLRVYVARLRKLLAVDASGQPALETSARGYVLRVDPDTVDLTRFRRLAAAGEFADALELWRGRALADLTDGDWARHESDALEELRLTALEERVDADLAVGRHSEVVPELEALLAEHPYRERFVAQLMLALYRCGRQPEALDTYATLRQALHDEFGLEPTPALRELEREILIQGRSLDLDRAAAATRVRASSSRTRSNRRLAGAALAFVVVLVLGVGTLVAVARDPASRSSAPIALKGNSVVAIDPSTSVVLGEIPLGGRPSGLAVGLGSVWVGNVDDETLLRIDPRTRRVVDTIGLGAAPTEVTVGAGSVWVLSLETNAVLQVDPSTNHVQARIPVRPIEPFAGMSQITDLKFTRGALWLRASPPPMLMRINPRTHSVAIVRRDVIRISSSGSALWAVLGIEANRVRRLYPRGRVVDLTSVGSIPSLSGFAADDHAVWVASRGGVVPRWASGTLWRIDANTGRVIASVLLNHASSGIALTPRAVWIATVDGHVLRVDAERARVTKTIALGLYAPNVAGTIAAGEEGVWVAALAP